MAQIVSGGRTSESLSTDKSTSSDRGPGTGCCALVRPPV